MYSTKSRENRPVQTFTLSTKLQKPQPPKPLFTTTVTKMHLRITWTLKTEVDTDGVVSTELTISVPNNLYSKNTNFYVRVYFEIPNRPNCCHFPPFSYDVQNGVFTLRKRFRNFDNGLAESDKCVMRYEIEIHGQLRVVRIQRMRDFSQGETGLTDVVLIVGEEKERFHVNKAVLAIHSSYFHTMFFGAFRESGQSEIELKNIDPVTFQQLLEILYLCPNIHELNVENLLDLARIYDAQPVTAQCRKFINGENALPKDEKLRLTQEYLGK